jgi:hypothetical protein
MVATEREIPHQTVAARGVKSERRRRCLWLTSLPSTSASPLLGHFRSRTFRLVTTFRQSMLQLFERFREGLSEIHIGARSVWRAVMWRMVELVVLVRLLASMKRPNNASPSFHDKCNCIPFQLPLALVHGRVLVATDLYRIRWRSLLSSNVICIMRWSSAQISAAKDSIALIPHARLPGGQCVLLLPSPTSLRSRSSLEYPPDGSLLSVMRSHHTEPRNFLLTNSNVTFGSSFIPRS